MNKKNQQTLTLLSSILKIPMDKLLERMISKYTENLPQKKLDELETALEALQLED